MREEIIVCKRWDLFGINFENYFSGFLSTDHILFEQLEKKIKREKIWFTQARDEVEEDEVLLQPIPYIVLKQGNHIFGYQRLAEGGEKRLVGKCSIGWGGHMNSQDQAPFRLFPHLMENALRELEEETTYQRSHNENPFKMEGFINFDDTPVNKVHFGIVMSLTLPDHVELTVNPNEQHKIDGVWFDHEALIAHSNLEGWSEVIRHVVLC